MGLILDNYDKACLRIKMGHLSIYGNLFNFQNPVFSGSPRSEGKNSARTESAQANLPNRPGEFAKPSERI